MNEWPDTVSVMVLRYIRDNDGATIREMVKALYGLTPEDDDYNSKRQYLHKVVRALVGESKVCIDHWISEGQAVYKIWRHDDGEDA